jgi:hypothetical protein
LAIFLCSFGLAPHKTTLKFEQEQVTKTDVDLCGTHTSRRPYGELGGVDRSSCCCFVTAVSAFGPISPGCGCNEDGVDEIVTEFKRRLRHRGDVLQWRQTELALERLDEVDAKLDLIMSHLQIPVIPKTTTMEERGEVKQLIQC